MPIATQSWQWLGAWTNGFAASDLNSLANGSQFTSTLSAPQIDNETGTPATHIAFEFTAGGSMTATTNGHILIALRPRLSDGTTYASSADGATVAGHLPWVNYPYATILLRPTASTEGQQSPLIPLRIGLFTVVAWNRSGVALPASGNMIKYRRANVIVSS